MLLTPTTDTKTKSYRLKRLKILKLTRKIHFSGEKKYENVMQSENYPQKCFQEMKMNFKNLTAIQKKNLYN